MSHRIVFLDLDTIGRDISLSRPHGHEWVDHGRTRPDEILARAGEASILIVNKVVLREDVLRQLGRLKLIAVCATGTDNIDLDFCRQRGILVSNVRGYAVHTVPEHVLALILTLRRSLFAYRNSVVKGAWQSDGQFALLAHEIRDLHGATLGIVGRGVLGQAVARLAEAFGMNVIYAGRKRETDPPSGRTPFEEVLERADVLSLHCPLTMETRGLLSAPEFARMKRRPILINTARGALVDEKALVDAIEAGTIAGAGIDVVSHEPPPLDHPYMRLAEKPNFILTPHIAWASVSARQRLADLLCENIAAFIAGNPRNLVGE